MRGPLLTILFFILSLICWAIWIWDDRKKEREAMATHEFELNAAGDVVGCVPKQPCRHEITGYCPYCKESEEDT